MKCFSSALWVFLCVGILSCKKNETIEAVPIPEGFATPVGIPDGTPASKKIIDTQGGTITSTDGKLKLTIPAGSFTSAQEVSIQTISNHNPLAIDKAYRLAPHGVEFNKPVTIEIEFSDDDIINTLPEALGIASQDANGVWQKQSGVVLNKNNNTLKVTTTHFSDWSLFESFYLEASQTVVPINGSVQLEVFTTEDILVPLVPGTEVAMGKKVKLSSSLVQEWKLAGAGNLQSTGAHAIYKAPATVPNAPNPVAVSVGIDLKQRGKFLLVRHIEITADDGEIELRVAGNGWVKKTASPAVKLGNGYYAIADSDGDSQGSYVLITWKGELGTHAYKSPEEQTGTHMHYLVTGANNYVCYYKNANDELVASGGGVTITSMGEDDGFIKGSFVVTPAGYGDDLKNIINIEGKFRVRKSWQ